MENRKNLIIWGAKGQLQVLSEFLDEEFCHMNKLFLYDFDPRVGKPVISSRDFKEIKKKLLAQLANFGSPIIKVVTCKTINIWM